LFLDQYGNYVLQGCLRFGAPYNDFIFETMLSQLWEISQGRFGARAMRACLEAHHATKSQQRLLAAAIALHSVQLAQNANGALLLTWLLDTCTFPRRRSVLAPRLVPHLVQLCTHKVAYLTVLKIINQRNEAEARDTVLKALFFSAGDSVLEQILSDQASGVTLIFKILTTPFLEDAMRSEIVQNVSRVLTKIKAQPNQGYKRIMDEVGMSSRTNQPSMAQYNSHAHPTVNTQARQSSQSQHGTPNGVQPPQFVQRQYSGTFVPHMNGSSYDNGMSPARTNSADPFGMGSYGMNGYQSQSPYQPMAPQNQFQNYNNNAQRSNNGYVANAFPTYGTPTSAVDPFRGMHNTSSSPLSYNASPILGSGGFPQQSFTQNVPNNMYNNYPQQQYGYFQTQMQTVQSGGRGRRVSDLTC
jgi:protein JSN1